MSLTKTNSTKTNTRVNQLSFGSPSVSLVLEHVELEPLALGNVRVQIEATNINPSDRLSIQGVGQYRRTHVPPRVPGFEAVGRVVEINDPHQCEFYTGQKVLVAQSGAWQSYVDAPAENVFAVPKELENGYACQLYINALTAWVITTQVAKLGEEDVVIINAGKSLMRLFKHLIKLLQLLVFMRHRLCTFNHLGSNGLEHVPTFQTARHQLVAIVVLLLCSANKLLCFLVLFFQSSNVSLVLLFEVCELLLKRLIFRFDSF